MDVYRHLKKHPGASWGLIISFASILFPFCAKALTAYELQAPSVITSGSPFSVTAGIEGPSPPAAYYKIGFSGTGWIYASAYSPCIPRTKAWPETIIATTLITYSTSTGIEASPTSTFAFSLISYSDATCETVSGGTLQFHKPNTSDQSWTIQILPAIYQDQIFPALGLSTGTNAIIGISSPDELCAGIGTTSTGWLDSVGAMFVRGICVGGAYMFVPSQNSINAVFSLKDTLYQKIPFGYLAQVSSTLLGITDSGPTTTPISFTIQKNESWGVPTTTIDIFDPSTIPQNLQDIFTIIRGFDIAIIGGLFLYWLINKLRSFHP